MKNYFPSKNQGYTYLQTNRSDVLGSIWSTFNIDLQSNLGVMRVAPRLKLNTSTADDADFGRPVAFQYALSRIWAICGTRVFVSPSAAEPQSAPFTEDASSGAATDYSPIQSDAEIFNELLWTTTTDDLLSKSSTAGAWTSRITPSTLSSGDPHMLNYFEKGNRLYLTNNGSQVSSIAVNPTGIPGPYTYSNAVNGDEFAIDLGSVTQNYITSIKSTSTSIWIGTINTADKAGYGSVFEWDGISNQTTNEYKLKAQGCLAIVIKDNVPYGMDSNGCLVKYSGYGFEEVGRLPLNNQTLKFSGDSLNQRFIHPNGMTITKNNTILVLVQNLNNDSTSSINENLPSGVWEWSEEFGFVHKYSFTYNPVGNSTITDFGQNRISTPGALASMNVQPSSPTANRNGTLMLGTTYFTDATTSTNGIFIDDSNNIVQKKGYFVTTWFMSDEIEDKWTRLWSTYRRLLDSNDSVVFKYRLNEESPVYADIIWVNTTSFTTTTDITSYGPTSQGFNGTVGGEVEILQGTGSGSCVHITNISAPVAGVYTVTTDGAVTGVTTGTAKARFQKWIKLFPSVPLNQVTSWSQFSINAPNIRIQIKGCMTFTGNGEFYKMAIFSNEDTKISA